MQKEAAVPSGPRTMRWPQGNGPENEEAPMFKKSHILGLFDNATAAGKNNPLFLTKFPQGLCFLLAKGCLAFPK